MQHKGQQTHCFFDEVVLDGAAEAAAHHAGPKASEGVGEGMPGVLPVPGALVLRSLKLPLVLLVQSIQPDPAMAAAQKSSLYMCTQVSCCHGEGLRASRQSLNILYVSNHHAALQATEPCTLVLVMSNSSHAQQYS